MALTHAGDLAREHQHAALDRGLRRFRWLGWGIVGLGILALGFVPHQLFLTTWLAEANQPELTEVAIERFATVEVLEVPYEAPPPSEPVAPGVRAPRIPDAPAEVASIRVEATPAESEAFAIIKAPALERLSQGWTVVEGVGVAELKTGAGHMPDTPLPGMPGNSVISGHRTTYGAPFNELDELVAGDLIEVETGTGVHTYVVRESAVVAPTELWVTDDRSGAWLTLTTCHPEFSSRERLVVFAELAAGPNWEAIYG